MFSLHCEMLPFVCKYWLDIVDCSLVQNCDYCMRIIRVMTSMSVCFQGRAILFALALS